MVPPLFSRMRRQINRSLLGAAVLAWAVPAHAADTKIAVAANFIGAAKEIGRLFERRTGHRAVFSFGSTGQLYTQITQGAPYEVFLAADRVRPERAIAAGHAVKGSRFTYATGRIALFSMDKSLVKGGESLARGGFAKIAIANPVTAPYGAAAVETMKALGVYARLRPKIVQGNNIAQTYQFVESGAAEVGFVALSLIAHHDKGSRWIVPARLHTAIRQDAVVLERGRRNEAALAFIGFLKGEEARAVKEKYGYGAGE